MLTPEQADVIKACKKCAFFGAAVVFALKGDYGWSVTMAICALI